MDGVLVDFFNAALRIHGRSEFTESNWPKNFDMAAVLGLSKAKFWEPLDTDHFWEKEVKLYPWAKKLINLFKDKECYLLSTPSENGATGKQRFINTHLPMFKDRYLLGSCKEACAAKNTLLIDDLEKNCEKFKKAGGYAILFPRPWNKHRGIEFEQLFEQLKSKLFL